MNAEAMTKERVKEKFRAEGKTIKSWAQEQGYPINSVYRVLNGFDKAAWGRAHEIATKLGMKSVDTE